MIYIIGLGPGQMSYLTEKGRRAIEASEVLIGGKRNLESLPEFQGERLVLGNNLKEVLAYIKTYGETKNISVIASGDPLIYGIGKYLAANLPQVEIISGISSIQYFFSQIQLDMNDLYITSSHGKSPNFELLLAHEKVAMVTDQKIGPSEIAEEIQKRGLNKILWIGENLSYENEKITKAKAEEVIGKKFEMNVVIIVDEK